MYHTIFYYDSVGEFYTSMLFHMHSVNVTDICYVFERGFPDRRVTAITMYDGIQYIRENVGWRIL